MKKAVICPLCGSNVLETGFYMERLVRVGLSIDQHVQIEADNHLIDDKESNILCSHCHFSEDDRWVFEDLGLVPDLNLVQQLKNYPIQTNVGKFVNDTNLRKLFDKNHPDRNTLLYGFATGSVSREYKVNYKFDWSDESFKPQVVTPIAWPGEDYRTTAQLFVQNDSNSETKSLQIELEAEDSFGYILLDELTA